MKALIAFSDTEIMMSLCEALAETKVDLELCSTFFELREALTHSRPDIIFCQPLLQDGTFRNLLQFLDAKGLSPAVVVCAGNYDKRTYLDAMTLGAFDYVAFPFEKSALDWIVGNAEHRLLHSPEHTPTRVA